MFFVLCLGVACKSSPPGTVIPEHSEDDPIEEPVENPIEDPIEELYLETSISLDSSGWLHSMDRTRENPLSG